MRKLVQPILAIAFFSLFATAALATEEHHDGDHKGSKSGDISSTVSTGDVTQSTVGSDNESEVILGSKVGDAKAKNIKSTVSTGDITQSTVGNDNKTKTIMGSAVEGSE